MSPSILQFIADFNSQLRYNSNSHVRKYTNISLNFSEIRLPYQSGFWMPSKSNKGKEGKPQVNTSKFFYWFSEQHAGTCAIC